jgi:hypothetical protein
LVEKGVRPEKEKEKEKEKENGPGKGDKKYDKIT